ncbi:hypothetical protein XH98_26465 [Bradyrhizobium sp. CCBAU 51745]|nr:hypothetical protein [Bradyrhizobium sp. CCBAU 51745]
MPIESPGLDGLSKAGAALADLGKIVRTKSKFKAEPGVLGFGAALSPIYTGFKIDAAALRAARGALQNRLDNARAGEILYA